MRKRRWGGGVDFFEDGDRERVRMETMDGWVERRRGRGGEWDVGLV